MNKILFKKGYRLYQSSYDKDEKGTILSVNYDPFGMAITYFGYFLLLVGFITVFFQKSGRFRTLVKELNKYSSLKIIVFSFFILSSAHHLACRSI
jgi:hypothetical protein